jgi:hypothetical protein
MAGQQKKPLTFLKIERSEGEEAQVSKEILP